MPGRARKGSRQGMGPRAVSGASFPLSCHGLRGLPGIGSRNFRVQCLDGASSPEPQCWGCGVGGRSTPHRVGRGATWRRGVGAQLVPPWGHWSRATLETQRFGPSRACPAADPAWSPAADNPCPGPPGASCPDPGLSDAGPFGGAASRGRAAGARPLLGSSGVLGRGQASGEGLGFLLPASSSTSCPHFPVGAEQRRGRGRYSWACRQSVGSGSGKEILG